VASTNADLLVLDADIVSRAQSVHCSTSLNLSLSPAAAVVGSGASDVFSVSDVLKKQTAFANLSGHALARLSCVCMLEMLPKGTILAEEVLQKYVSTDSASFSSRTLP
jgi:hypothetical protein